MLFVPFSASCRILANDSSGVVLQVFVALERTVVSIVCHDEGFCPFFVLV